MRRHSFYRRIQLSFIIFILVPVLTVSVISYAMTKNTLMEKIRTTHQSVLDVMAKDITKLIDDLTFVSHYYVKDEQIRSQLKAFRGKTKIESFDDYNTYLAIQQFFDQVSIKALDKNMRVFLVNDAGFIVPYMDSSAGMTLTEMTQDWERISGSIDLRQPTVIQWPGMIRPDDEAGNYVYMSRVIQDASTGELLATLNIGIWGGYFNPWFGGLNTSGGRFALFDAEGQRIAGTQSPEGQEVLRTETKIANAGWTLVYEVPNESITGEVTRTFQLSAVLVVTFSILFLFLSVVLARRIHLPIRRLQGVAKQFGGGNRKARYEVTGNDEINDLGGSLNQMFDQLNQLIADIESEQEQKRQLELQALFAQIRPHFLLNTLNSIKCSLLLARDRHHGQMIDSLMSLLRAYMKVNEPSTLQSECVLLKHYVDIMRMRNELPLELEYNVPEDLTSMMVPMLLLQPIVENAIVHGLSENEVRAVIQVSAQRLASHIEIEVSDNGSGMHPDQLMLLRMLLHGDEALQSGYERVGLLNVLQRLRLTYGVAATMDIRAGELGGTTVVLAIPSSSIHCLEA
ncbi:sensor histidine kinase YesM [Paenibacillus phyllosphaerae]|uniref:Sensor histidine kinase YesM n=1 Tax=Paenibacillus phyllosphaerae TaxID=274593 RepID=A0A7W5AXZ5_9BACL|nr:histidine kinase [Paenibacillus phyllosphaerae]MBB3110211.1 sensor histidine kinase YesM [Paenibacillus phyllosphaerae]